MGNGLRVADYIFKTLADRGVEQIFLLTGGGAMHLNDAIGREKRINYICNHHEQACAMAAEGYSRVTGKIGVVNVTTGPGGINALNGVFGAFTDSIPMLVISGQVKRETLLSTHGLSGKLRQLGDQEVDIVAMAKPVTKYAVLIKDPESIRYHLEKAIHLAESGRPGPCWIDVPVDVQAAKVDPETMKRYDPSEDAPTWNPPKARAQCKELAKRLAEAKRPVFLIGSGLYAEGAVELFEMIIRRLQIPVTTAWTAIDLMASDDPLYCGRPGTLGDRPGNFTVQNADLVIVLGCRLAIRQVSYNWESFAASAYKVQVDIDRAELEKPMVHPDMGIHADLRYFLKCFNEEIQNKQNVPAWNEWLSWCKNRLLKYPVLLDSQRNHKTSLNPYYFSEILFKNLDHRDVIACGDATASVVPFQAAFIKKGQRLFTNAGSASMGYDLPAAVGAACAKNGGRVICLAGEGSVMQNIQEIQTIVHHRLPVKIFVLNNGGYLSIRTTQKSFFNLSVGSGPSSGVSFPDFVALGDAFGIKSIKIDHTNPEVAIAQFLNNPGPGLAEVILDENQGFEPRITSRKLENGAMVTSSLEDMAPFLSREELAENMIAKAAGANKQNSQGR